MQDRTLYARLLGIEDPWRVTDVMLRLDDERAVVVSVELELGATLHCPKCQSQGSRYDSRERRWRHLDTMQYHTILVADVPRVRCDEHGVVQIAVPWSDSKSRFTALFEALVIDWLKEASFSAVARQLSLSWDQVAGIQDRAVRRGLARREKQRPRRIGVDETSFRKRAEYITVVNDLDRNRVLWVGDNRKKQTLTAFYAELGRRGCARLEFVAMDMWAPYIASTREHVPDADRRFVFDKFMVRRRQIHSRRKSRCLPRVLKPRWDIGSPRGCGWETGDGDAVASFAGTSSPLGRLGDRIGVENVESRVGEQCRHGLARNVCDVSGMIVNSSG